MFPCVDILRNICINLEHKQLKKKELLHKFRWITAPFRGAVKNEHDVYAVGSWPKDGPKNAIVERADPIIYRLYFCASIT